MHTRETTFEILESESPTDRVAVSMVRCGTTGESRVRLRQESFSDAVGWFTQSQIDLSPDQVAQLKSMLGLTAMRPTRPSPQRSTDDTADEPAILKLPSVLAG